MIKHKHELPTGLLNQRNNPHPLTHVVLVQKLMTGHREACGSEEVRQIHRDNYAQAEQDNNAELLAQYPDAKAYEDAMVQAAIDATDADYGTGEWSSIAVFTWRSSKLQAEAAAAKWNETEHYRAHVEPINNGNRE